MKKRIQEFGLALVLGLSMLQLFDALVMVAEYRAREKRERDLERIHREHLERMHLEHAVSFEPDDTAGDAETPPQ